MTKKEFEDQLQFLREGSIVDMDEIALRAAVAVLRGDITKLKEKIGLLTEELQKCDPCARVADGDEEGWAYDPHVHPDDSPMWACPDCLKIEPD